MSTKSDKRKADRRVTRARKQQAAVNTKAARRKARLGKRALRRHGHERTDEKAGYTPLPSDRPGKGRALAAERAKADKSKIEHNRKLADQANIKKGFKEAPVPVSEVDLRKYTNAELKKVCDDREIEYKAKATKGDLLALLGVK